MAEVGESRTVTGANTMFEYFASDTVPQKQPWSTYEALRKPSLYSGSRDLTKLSVGKYKRQRGSILI
jgi:hypothetical protein